MSLTDWALLLGVGLDALLGDPDAWPHPVRVIGGLIRWTEGVLRHRIGASRGAGVILVVVVAGSSGLVAWGFASACDRLGPLPSLIGRALLIYWGLAARSLGTEALRVANEADLVTARRLLARIVGRDTATLDRPEICRACVETVAENANDAVIAPLFWFAVGGPAGLWIYKAASTLDSMVGYRDDRYRALGWASARLDDLLALVPARLTWLLIVAASPLAGGSVRGAWRIGWRDGRKHPSPNSVWGEAAMAGALGIALGGPSTYGGVPGFKPLLGDHGDPLDPNTVRRAVRLMWLTSGLAVVLVLALTPP